MRGSCSHQNVDAVRHRGSVSVYYDGTDVPLCHRPSSLSRRREERIDADGAPRESLCWVRVKQMT